MQRALIGPPPYTSVMSLAGRSCVGRRNVAQVVAMVGGRARSRTSAGWHRLRRRQITERRRRGNREEAGKLDISY